MSETFAVGFYADETSLVAACRQAREAGHARIEAVSPYPIHGIDPVIGIPRSPNGRPVLFVALIGIAGAYALVRWMTVDHHPIVVSGKPIDWWPGFVIPALELGLLAAAIVNLLVCFHSVKAMPLPETVVVDPRLTDDRFALAIPLREGFTADSMAVWLQERGAIETRAVVWPPPEAAEAGEPAHA